jgi:hypothetical protein
MSGKDLGTGYGAVGKMEPRGHALTIFGRLPKRTMSWISAATVINASTVGIGVLCMPKCYAQLGWILGTVALVVFLLANGFVAYVMREIQRVEPLAISLPDAAFFASGGSEAAKQVVRWIIYGEKFAFTCPAVALAATTLGSAFYSWHQCHYTWCVITVAILIPLSTMQNFSEMLWLNVVNVLTIIGAIALVAYSLAREGPPLGGPGLSVGVPEGEKAINVFGALSTMVFAYAGNWLYFEVMSEMTTPGNFMKAFCVAGPIQLGLYAFVGAFGYYFWGSAVPSSIMDTLRFGGLMRSASFLLAVHVFAGTALGVVVLLRFLHSRVAPTSLNQVSTKGRCVRFTLSVAVYGVSLLVVLAVPSFRILVTLLGALFEAPISFIMPSFTYWGVMRKRPQESTLAVSVGCMLLCVMGACITVLGVVDAVGEISAHKGGRPFACNCAGIWNTCECSTQKMPPGTCGTQRLGVVMEL